MKPPKIRVITASKWVEKDSFEHGCDPGSTDVHSLLFDQRALFDDLPHAFRSITDEPIIGKEEIGVIDNNYYQDVKGSPHPRVVRANQERGLFRAYWDRLETKNGKVPSAATKAKWKASKIKFLYAARYEIEFEVIYAGLDENEVAELCGVQVF